MTPMRSILMVLVVAVLTAQPLTASRRLIASDIPGARISKPGKIVISNDQNSITAFHLHNDVRTALVRLRATRSMRYRPFGSALFDSRATLNSPVPIYLAPIIQEAARHSGIDPRLLAAVARRESRFQPHAVSHVGALGVMQLMPLTAKFLGVSNAFDARENIFGGARYLKMLLNTFNGDLDLTLAAYNAGPGAVRKYRGVPPYRETVDYVAAIRRDYEASLR